MRAFVRESERAFVDRYPDALYLPSTEVDDPGNTGRGDPGEVIAAEPGAPRPGAGSVSMARCDESGSAGDPFRIVLRDPGEWKEPPESRCTVFAEVVDGIEIARRVTLADVARGDAFTSPDAVRDYLRLVLGPETVEVFVGLFLDSQHRLISAEELARGTLAQTSVYPREVVKTALARNAAAVIFAHNHPSGVAGPSRADELLTQSLKSALSLVDVRTLDHQVVAGPRVTSFAERGLL